MNNRFEFAKSLIIATKDIHLKYYRNLENISLKNDNSPVTIADQEIEEFIRAKISKHFPDDGITAEEFEDVTSKSGYKWVVDPIDGTKSFTIGRPLFTTLIALELNNEIIFGFIYQPITNDLWIGNEISTLNNEKVQTSKIKTLEEAILCTTGPQYFASKEDKLFFDKLSDKCKYTIYGGDAYNYGLLASGKIDIIFESGLKYFDIAAPASIVANAGGVIRTKDNKSISKNFDGSALACSTNELLEQALDLKNA